jgi:HK97 gp10 family phage protein
MSATLKSRLPGIAAQLQPRVSAAVKTGAEWIAEDASGNVVYGPGDVHLADSFKVEREGPASYSVYNDALSETGKRQVPYAHMVEFGTTKMAAQPFLLPAAENRISDIEALVTGVLRGL